MLQTLKPQKTRWTCKIPKIEHAPSLESWDEEGNFIPNWPRFPAEFDVIRWECMVHRGIPWFNPVWDSVRPVAQILLRYVDIAPKTSMEDMGTTKDWSNVREDIPEIYSPLVCIDYLT